MPAVNSVLASPASKVAKAADRLNELRVEQYFRHRRSREHAKLVATFMGAVGKRALQAPPEKKKKTAEATPSPPAPPPGQEEQPGSNRATPPTHTPPPPLPIDCPLLERSPSPPSLSSARPGSPEPSISGSSSLPNGCEATARSAAPEPEVAPEPGAPFTAWRERVEERFLKYFSTKQIQSFFDGQWSCSRGCDRNCKSLVQAADICAARAKFYSESCKQKRLEKLEAFLSPTLGSKGRLLFAILAGGKIICRNAYMRVLGVSAGVLRSAESHAFTNTLHKPIRRKRKAVKQELIVAWIKLWLEEVADQSPVDDKFYLPMFLSWAEVYREFAENQAKDPKGAKATYQYFFFVVRQQFQNVKMPKRTRLGRCEICNEIDSLRRRCGGNKASTAELKKFKCRHLRLQRAERQAYADRRAKSKADPQVLSTIVDKTKAMGLPYHGRPGKNELRMWRYLVDILGILDHTTPTRYFYLLPQLWKSDPNVTMSALLDYLQRVKKARGYMPKTWYLQMDNCWRENKNRWVLALLASLVADGTFDEIYVSFLIPGS